MKTIYNRMDPDHYDDEWQLSADELADLQAEDAEAKKEERMLHWRDGKEMCRKCIYDVWESEGPWRRTPSDEVFPIYEDGKDYTLMTATERSTKSTQEIF